MVEDVAADAELMLRELRRAGVRCATRRVESGTDLRRALHEFAPDIVLADHALPQFSALDALHLVRHERPLTPVILVTGSLDEETAVDLIKEGAADCVVKHRLFRLGPAVQRALALRRALEDAAAAESARTRAEGALRRQTEFLSHAQAAAGVGSWEWDIATDAITWSDETYRIFGVDPTEGPITYERYLELIHPDDRAGVAAEVSWSLQTREPFALDHRIVRPDGTLHFLHGRGGVVTDAGGRPVRMLGAVLDITGRKKAEEALRRANDRLNAVIQSSPLAISTLDADGVVRTWNPAAEQLFGWTADEVIGRPLPTVHGEAAEFEETRRRVMRGDPVSNVEVIRKKKDGTPVTVNLVAAPLHEADGRITGILGLIEDRTGVKRLEQQFFQAQKMEAVGRLAGGIAHDFNNLLTVITSYSDLLLEDLGPDDPHREDLAQIRKASESAAALTRQLLAFSRQQVLQPQVLDLNGTVAGTEMLLKRLIGEDVQLATLLAPNLGMAIIDPGQLEQIIMNLVVNARDAMPGGGRLTIETANVDMDETYLQAHPPAQAGRYVMLAVSDTGTGMDARTQAHIFEPFFTTKASGKGTGLGLATVYGIVKQSGGFIWVYSEPGHGTTFKIYFPWAGEPAQRSAAAPVATPRQGTETVLVVEDAASVRTVMRQGLERYGYTVLEAPDGDTALQLAAKHHGAIHLLLTDVVMPGVSGRQLADQLVRLRPGIKVLYASGYTDDAIIHHGILEPGIAYLQKPFTRDALARTVREVLDGA